MARKWSAQTAAPNTPPAARGAREGALEQEGRRVRAESADQGGGEQQRGVVLARHAGEDLVHPPGPDPHAPAAADAAPLSDYAHSGPVLFAFQQIVPEGPCGAIRPAHVTPG